MTDFHPHTLTLTFLPLLPDQPLHTHGIAANGLQGFFFELLAKYDTAFATNLHDTPAAYTLTPMVQNRLLVGMRVHLFARQSAETLQAICERCHNERTTLSIGKLYLLLSSVMLLPGSSLTDLLSLPPCQQVSLDFQTPTAFGQRNNPANMLFPMPEKIYSPSSGPLRVWNSALPPALHVGRDWLMWVHGQLFVSRHQIRTVSRRHTVQLPFIGFMGSVTLRAAKGSDTRALAIWHALTHLAPYSGIGRKTTYGMGAVAVTEIIT